MKQLKGLYIFVTSDIPDVYINTIGYCIEHFDISKVTLLGIVKDKGQQGAIEAYLREVRDRITNQLSLLQEGKYLYKDQNTKDWKEKSIDIQTHNKIRYAKIASQKIEPHTIIYSALESEIIDFLKSNDNNCLFDVSAILKGYLVDVFVLLLSRKIEDIYTFELKLRGRTYDEKELIHNLSLDRGDYEFVNLTRSDYTKDKVIKSKQEDEKAERASQILEKAIDVLASNFATTILTIYTVFVIISLVIIIIVVTRTNWSTIEPWTFILFGMPLLSYLISLIMQLLLRKELSLRPKNIFDWIMNRKVKKLAKELGLAN